MKAIREFLVIVNGILAVALVWASIKESANYSAGVAMQASTPMSPTKLAVGTAIVIALCAANAMVMYRDGKEK